MADKQQNITINYKFNTADVDKANQSLNQANAASNKLQQAGAKAGSAINQEFQKSNKTILDMQNALTRLKSIIEITSNPAKLRQLSAEYRNIKTQMDAATKSAFGLEKAVQNQGSSFGQLGNIVKGVFSGIVIKQIASVTLELAKLSGNAEGVQRAFERAFPNSFTILNELREATRGTVTDFELMQRTLQATNLGVAVKELPVLFEFAAARAQQTGESVDYLVDSIVRGIGRKSPLILDNLGLSATRLKEKFDGAALASQSVADVTRGVAEIAREELAKMGGYVVTGATRVAQLETAWEQLRITFAKRIDSSGIINFFKEAIQGTTAALKTDKEINAELAKMRAATEFQSLQETRLADTRIEGGKKVKQTSQELVNATQAEIRERFKLIEASKVELLILKQKFDQASHTKNNTTEEINQNIKIREQIVQQGLVVRKNISFYEETIKLLKAYNQELNKPGDLAPSSGIIERKKEEIKAIQEQIEKTNKLGDLGVAGKLTIALEIAQAELSDLQRAFFDFNEIDLTKKFEKITKEVENAAKALGDISGVLAGIDADIKDGIKLPVTVVPPEFKPSDWQKFTDDLEKNWRDITSTGIDIQADQLKSMQEAELDSYKQRLTDLHSFYDEQQLLAGDNEKAKEMLRLKEQREVDRLNKEIARKEKQVRRNQVIIDIASGIAKALATYPWPYSLIPAAFVAGQGAAQLAIINRTNYAKGSPIGIKGPGTETSDSIPANLSRGESVMTAWETRHAGDVLKDIRAKKIDNKVLRDLKQGRAPVQQQVFNDERIIKAIKEWEFPDVIEQSHIVYKSTKYSDEYKKRIRSSSMSI